MLRQKLPWNQGGTRLKVKDSFQTGLDPAAVLVVRISPTPPKRQGGEGARGISRGQGEFTFCVTLYTKTHEAPPQLLLRNAKCSHLLCHPSMSAGPAPFTRTTSTYQKRTVFMSLRPRRPSAATTLTTADTEVDKATAGKGIGDRAGIRFRS